MLKIRYLNNQKLFLNLPCLISLLVINLIFNINFILKCSEIKLDLILEFPSTKLYLYLIGIF